ncbi:MAG: hypothetical protein Q9221_003835 [Calogaya cf. arnoldii]
MASPASRFAGLMLPEAALEKLPLLDKSIEDLLVHYDTNQKSLTDLTITLGETRDGVETINRILCEGESNFTRALHHSANLVDCEILSRPYLDTISGLQLKTYKNRGLLCELHGEAGSKSTELFHAYHGI